VIAIGPQTGVEAQKSKPDHPTIDRSFGSTVKRVSNRAAGHPDENQSGRGRIGANGTWARSGRNVMTTRMWD
jgi:hypothetical protein